MRLKKHFSTLLVERNVINIDEVEDFITELIKRRRLSNEEARWVKTTVRKWLINDYEHTSVVKSAGRYTGKKGMEWVDDAIERGEQVHYVQLAGPLSDKIAHVIDWIRAEELRSLNRLSMQQALKATEKWDRERAKRAKMIKDQGETSALLELKGGYTLYKLLDKQSYKWEGKQMGHCVGDSYSPDRYEDDPEAGIFSIRDKRGMPHVTIESDGFEIVQIQGKENKTPVAKHMVAVNEVLKRWFKAVRFEESDSWEMGMVMDTKGDFWNPFDIPPGLSFKTLNMHSEWESEPYVLQKNTTVDSLYVGYRQSATILDGCRIGHLTCESTGDVRIGKSSIGIASFKDLEKGLLIRGANAVSIQVDQAKKDVSIGCDVEKDVDIREVSGSVTVRGGVKRALHIDDTRGAVLVSGSAQSINVNDAKELTVDGVDCTRLSVAHVSLVTDKGASSISEAVFDGCDLTKFDLSSAYVHELLLSGCHLGCDLTISKANEIKFDDVDGDGDRNLFVKRSAYSVNWDMPEFDPAHDEPVLTVHGKVTEVIGDPMKRA